jgi:hypothetical protein
MKKNAISICLAWAFSCLAGFSQSFVFDFSTGSNGFTGGVSDFGVNQSEQHQFVFENEALPPPLNPGQNAQYLSGTNPSDDLFMYMKRKVKGLKPNTLYQVHFVVEFASIYPTNAIGVGGPPGEGVTMKAGITLVEPDTMVIDKSGDYVVMNIDKGNQSQPGPDMDTIGHVGVSDTTTVYTLKTNHNLFHPFAFTTDQSGEAWVIVGTDSGFESTTAIYYTHVEVQFFETTGTKEDLASEDVLIYPNPSPGMVYIRSMLVDIDSISIYDISGRLFRSLVFEGNGINVHLPRGEYIVQFHCGNNTTTKKLLVGRQ